MLIYDRKVYASGSSLSTRRKHLEGHAEEYVQITTKYKLQNKLPEERRKLLEISRAQ
jgi:hypothetical protein